MSRLMPVAHGNAQQAVSSMMHWIEASYSFQNIILVGGGAFLFKRAVKAALPKHRIYEIRDPMYANVKEFQIGGMDFARNALDREIRFQDHTRPTGETV